MRTLYLSLIASAALAVVGCDGSDNDNNGGSSTGPVATPCDGQAVSPQRLFLQQLTDTSVIVKWRGNTAGGAEAEKLCFGPDGAQLVKENEVQAQVTATGHREALISGLDPDTRYYYSVGGAATADANHYFTTAPVKGSLPADGNVRIWIVGDSGDAGIASDHTGGREVRDGFLKYVQDNGGQQAELFLMLGDNAYYEGTDQQYQAAVFDVYPEILAKTPLWSTIGNHEMGSFGTSTSSDPDSFKVLSAASGTPDPAPDRPMPYLNIFSLPTAGEAGGVRSGNEQYYSFDYANVHIVSLDSQLTVRDATGRETMKQWLIDDLSANTQDWTIVIFHHPPYSKGTHDSDKTLGGIDQPMFDMREQFTPIFDEYGVDLVYTGHSHVYERSYYIKGHTGLSNTFDQAIHPELNPDGTMASGQGNQAYTQITSSGLDDRSVYTVAGNGGVSVGPAVGMHPVNFALEVALGSVVVDLNEDQLVARSIGTDGQQRDWFTITR